MIEPVIEHDSAMLHPAMGGKGIHGDADNELCVMTAPDEKREQGHGLAQALVAAAHEAARREKS